MSQPIDDGGPAFPCDSTKQFPTQEGMTLRDWFAGQALSGMVNPQWPSFQDKKMIAELAYKHADAMLAARKESQPE